MGHDRTITAAISIWGKEFGKNGTISRRIPLLLLFFVCRVLVKVASIVVIVFRCKAVLERAFVSSTGWLCDHRDTRARYDTMSL